MEEHNNNGFDRADRDLLITLNVKVGDLITTIRDLKDTNMREIGELRAGKLDKTFFTEHITEDKNRHETIDSQLDKLWIRSDANSRLLWIGVGAVAVIQVLVPILVKYFWK